MKLICIIFGVILSLFFIQNSAIAANECGKIDVYFNDQLLSGDTVATPTIKIGEPFNIKINMTVFREYKVSGQISEIGKGNFEVVKGPSQMNEYSSIILKPNESHTFEWIVRPTDGWSGGSLPINFRYSLVEKGNPEPIINSGFTVAYCTISNEYYEGEAPTSEAPTSEAPTSKAPTSEEKPVTETESSVKSEPISSSASASGFSLAGTVSVLALAFAFFRNCKL